MKASTPCDPLNTKLTLGPGLGGAAWWVHRLVGAIHAKALERILRRRAVRNSTQPGVAPASSRGSLQLTFSRDFKRVLQFKVKTPNHERQLTLVCSWVFLQVQGCWEALCGIGRGSGSAGFGHACIRVAIFSPSCAWPELRQCRSKPAARLLPITSPVHVHTHRLCVSHSPAGAGRPLGAHVLRRPRLRAARLAQELQALRYKSRAKLHRPIK